MQSSFLTPSVRLNRNHMNEWFLVCMPSASRLCELNVAARAKALLSLPTTPAIFLPAFHPAHRVLVLADKSIASLEKPINAAGSDPRRFFFSKSLKPENVGNHNVNMAFYSNLNINLIMNRLTPCLNIDQMSWGSHLASLNNLLISNGLHPVVTSPNLMKFKQTKWMSQYTK